MSDPYILSLRAPEPEDLELLFLWENDKSVWQAGQTITPFSRFILKQYLQDAQKDIFEMKQLRLMVDLLESGNTRTVGTIDYFDFDPMHQRAGIGILIGDLSDRGNGLGTYALKEAISYAFDILQLHQLYCNILESNQRSLALFKKQGFEEIGVKKEWVRLGNQYHHEVILQLINPSQ